MDKFWARLPTVSGQPGPDYWTFFAERIAHLANIPNSATILDIGTFDGNVLFKAMQKITGQGVGIGIDIDPDDFPAGMAEARQRGWAEKIAFAQMNANRLGFPSETFDRVLANFVGWDDRFDFQRMEFIGTDNLTAEIRRVLKPGGQVGIGGWIAQNDIDWIAEEFRKHLPDCRKGISCYSRENPEGYRIILHKAGFENIHVVVETTDFISPDAETWWRQMKQAAHEYFVQVTEPMVLEDLREKIFTDLRHFECPEEIRFSKTVVYAFGTKPL